MTERKLLHDIIFLAISIALAIFLFRSGFVATLVQRFEQFGVWGSLLAGAAFSSLFTTAPAIAVLAGLANHVPLPILVGLGALGAVCADILLFAFVQNRLKVDFAFLARKMGWRHLPRLLRAQWLRWLTPLLGALIIASPLPDELGVVLLGIGPARVPTMVFISFIANAVGITLIALAGKAL